MKKLLIVLLLTFLAGTLLAQTAIPPSTGDGTSGNPYQIATLNNLYWITQNSSSWSKYFIQTSDIDATSCSFWDDGAGFSPIGNSTTPFTGFYDGQSYMIMGLSIGRSTNYIGFFGTIRSAVIKNARLDSVRITGYEYVGGLIGYLNDSSTVTNCYSSGSVTGGSNYIGGLIGTIDSNSTVASSFSRGVISGVDYVGGLIGYEHLSKITNCYSFGFVTGTEYAGGLIGVQAGSTATNCYCADSVSGTYSYGSLIGANYSGTSLDVNCFWDKTLCGAGGYGIGESTTAMKNYLTYTGWSFKGLTGGGIWNIGNGRNNGYPYLNWQYVATVQLSNNNINFDTVRIGQFKETTVTISNTGNDTLKISNIASLNAMISIRPTILYLPPGITFTDTLRLTPTVYGTTSATVLIASNSPSSPDTIKMSGFGFGSAMQFNTKAISFGNVSAGIFKDTTLTITNTGNDTLKIINITSSRSTFTARPTSTSIAPGHLFVDTLRFLTFTVGSDSALLVIQSNSGGSPDTVKVTGASSPTTSVKAKAELPTIYSLNQNYPNPFNPSTTISFNLPSISFVSLKVFDINGREVATIASEEMSAGSYSRQWNASSLASGVYFYRLQTGAFTETKKLLFLK